ncbi:MAG: TonB-dependent receptor [Pseudomonadota bacterium]|nr:TonB-dependent receptor [Pseudomonadota bacterium]
MLKRDENSRGMLKLNPLSAAIAAAFAYAAAPQVAVAQTDSTDEEAVDLGEFEVTGSRLGRADVEGALPVSVINRDDIDASGFTSVGELLRNTVFNSAGAFRAQSGSSAQGLVAVDLRGLGSQRTLVLIDGRRAPKAPYAPTAQDLNAVPLAAVERIEILKDGAGAIYGSDAIGGVINVITRKDYEGVEVSYQVQSNDREGGDVEQGNVTIGISGDRGNMVIGASYFQRDIIFARDSLFNSPGASFFSNNLIWGEDTDGDGTTDGYVYAPVPGGCPAPTTPGYFITGAGLCGYDFTLVSADEAETGNRGLFTKGFYEINDDWGVTVNASINRATSFGRYAPSLNDVSLTIPIDNAFLDEQAAGIDPNTLSTPIYFYHRFAGLGTRDTTTDANVYDLSGIFEGRIGAVNVEFGARHNEYKFFETGRNFVVLPIVQSYLDSDTYDYTDPLSNSDAVLNSMKATIGRESIWRTEEAFAGFDMPVFEMSGGTAQLAGGFEYRTEEYNDQYDSLSEGGAIGGSAGNSAGTDRTVRALYGEMLLPIMDTLEVSVAARYDDYSDYGSDTSPSVRLRYQPLPDLALRASYSAGFRAPSLDLISQKPAFSAESISNDGPSCVFNGGTFDTSTNTCRNADGSVRQFQINATQIANPDLASEQSDQFSLGVAYQVTSFFDFSLDYYNIQITDRIDTLTPSEILDSLRVGDPVPAAFTVTRGNNNDPNARITNIVFGFANNGELDTSGLDFEGNFSFAMGGLGTIESQLRYVHILEYKIDGGRDQVGDPSLPEYRMTANTRWTWSDLEFSWNMNIIGDQAETTNVQPDGSVSQDGHVPTYVTHDFQLGYTTPWNGTIAVGAINAFGKEPDQRSAFDGRDYNFYLYDQYGTQPYVRYTQRF